MISIFIGVEVDNDLSVTDVWPDGDAPENPTADDVAALLEKGGLKRNLEDWSLMDGAVVTISVHDGHGGVSTKKLFVR
jgi:hypothetical protein